MRATFIAVCVLLGATWIVNHNVLVLTKQIRTQQYELGQLSNGIAYVIEHPACINVPPPRHPKHHAPEDSSSLTIHKMQNPPAIWPDLQTMHDDHLIFDPYPWLNAPPNKFHPPVGRT